MKLSTIFAGAAIAATGASAQQAVVHNKCNVPIYVQSFPYNGGAAGPLTTVQPGQAFSEDFRKSGSVRLSLLFSTRVLISRCRLSRIPLLRHGSDVLITPHHPAPAELFRAHKLTIISSQTVKIGKTKLFKTPLFFGYSFSNQPDVAYCMLYTVFPNVFPRSFILTSPNR